MGAIGADHNFSKGWRLQISFKGHGARCGSEDVVNMKSPKIVKEC